MGRVMDFYGQNSANLNPTYQALRSKKLRLKLKVGALASQPVVFMKRGTGLDMV